MLEVDKKTFEEEVLQADGYVVVDFYGDGCVPCQALMPHVHALADQYGDKLKFAALNTSKEKIEELVKDDATADAVKAMVEKYV